MKLTVPVRTTEELELMRRAGKIVSDILDELESRVKPGISTFELDRISERLIAKNGAKPAFKGYNGFPCCLCASVNEEVVHGIPSKKRVLQEGDLMKLDFGVVYKGWFGDSARTVAVGKITDEDRKLIEVTKKSLELGIAAARIGNRVGAIGHAVQAYVEANGFSVVRDFQGHGVGRALHEQPSVPNYGPADDGPDLMFGQTIAIEPMVNSGTHKVEILDDEWTAVTLDRKRSAHFEHTIVVTDGEPVILTRP
jgi:methionyl aminopeptidase